MISKSFFLYQHRKLIYKDFFSFSLPSIGNNKKKGQLFYITLQLYYQKYSRILLIFYIIVKTVETFVAAEWQLNMATTTDASIKLYNFIYIYIYLLYLFIYYYCFSANRLTLLLKSIAKLIASELSEGFLEISRSSLYTMAHRTRFILLKKIVKNYFCL